MHLNDHLSALAKMLSEVDCSRKKKRIKRMIALISELESRNLPNDKLLRIRHTIEDILDEIHSPKATRKGYKRIRHYLMRNHAFIPANYYVTMLTGVGLALGTGLGVSIGAVFLPPIGIVLGVSIGSGLGMMAGVLIGKQLDERAAEEKRVLSHL